MTNSFGNSDHKEESSIPVTPEEKIGQQKVGLVVAGLVFGAIVMILSFVDMGGGLNMQDTQDKEDVYEITIADPTKNVKSEDRWLVNAQSRLDDQQSSIEQTKEENERLKEEIEALKEGRLIEDSKFQQLESKIYDLMDRINNKNPNPQNYNQSPDSQLNGQNPPDVSNQPLIETVTFDDSDDSYSGGQSFNVDDGYLPQGSYVKAKIISSVDAQVGVSSQSNPKPVLLRVNGEAKSALFNDKKLSIDIKGCIITGGAMGELSSEKVYIKLSKMTCATNDSEVTEVAVKGYVAALGSSGVRGRVIMREGELVTKSFLAGVFGGVGSAFSQSLAPPLTFGGGTTTQQSISAKDAGKRGVGTGLGNASDRLSEYLIKRAEQYQPVITIPSGIDVEVVFLEGLYLDGRKMNPISNNESK